MPRITPEQEATYLNDRVSAISNEITSLETEIEVACVTMETAAKRITRLKRALAAERKCLAALKTLQQS